jgi:hypothetical protein
MAKLRLKLSHYEIIMSKIIIVVINNVEFKKSDFITNTKPSDKGWKSSNTRIIQEFYNFIKRNQEYINFISYKIHSLDDQIYFLYLKNGKIHNLDGPAIYQKYKNDIFLGNYYIDGEKIEYKQWQKKTRAIKLKTLNNVI